MRACTPKRTCNPYKLSLAETRKDRCAVKPLTKMVDGVLFVVHSSIYDGPYILVKVVIGLDYLFVPA